MVYVPPAASMIDLKTSCISFAILISLSAHLKWKRSTGIPH